MKEIDCFGLSCPIPVVNTKKALKDNPDTLSVLVDNVAAKENVSRFGRAMSYNVSVTEIEGGWKIELKK
ncbi:MAG: sulfurtransferase TusA family protein [Sphaerochaetaceae bacterium]|nr:sulfurtransferase TusA family protein [Sphaerochaetaceae bacterium]